MNFRDFLAAVVVALAMTGCSAAIPPAEQAKVVGNRCATLPDVQGEVARLLAADNIQRVEPEYHTVRHVGGPLPLYVSGARIHVPAEPGANEAYLERVLACHAASVAGDGALSNDPLRVAGVRAIAVRSAHQSFSITVTGADREAGAEIWQRTRALHRGQVQVEQLAATTRSSL